MKFILSMTIAFALGLGVLSACQSTATSSGKNETVKTNTNAVVNTNTNVVVNSVQKADEQKQMNDAPRITLADAKKDFDAGKVIFVDTRAEVQYKQEHIKSAINIPAEAMETRYKEIPTSKKIIAYCS